MRQMSTETWDAVRALCGRLWPKRWAEIVPAKVAGESPLDEMARLALGRKFKDDVMRLDLDTEQVTACLSQLAVDSKWAPSAGEIIKALKYVANGDPYKPTAWRPPEPEGGRVKRTPAPWKLYERDKAEALRLYPWLTEPCTIAGVDYGSRLDHPMYADIDKKRRERKAKAETEAKLKAEREARAQERMTRASNLIEAVREKRNASLRESLTGKTGEVK
jgi:hypothetical protein